MKSSFVRPIAMALCAVLTACARAESANDIREERPQPVAAFIDSVGVNVHLSYRSGPYGNVAAVAALLQRLGVHHVRDGVTLAQPDVCAADRELAARDIRFDYITQPGLGASQLRRWAACVGPALELFEGPNEYDISHPQTDSDWPTTLRRAQTALYQSVKNDPTLAAYRVIGPSLTSEAAYRSVGDLSTSMDVGNMHNYLAGHEPGTGGWGLGGYGSIPWNAEIARLTDGSHPIMATENGYSSDGSDPKAVTAELQGIYVPVLLLEHFARGVPRTYYYELLDEGGAPFGHYGLADGALQPKPAFNAVAGLMDVLRDVGRGTPSDAFVRFAFDGADEQTRHLLFAKRDGTIAFVVWQNEALYDVNFHREIEAVPRNVTLRLPLGYRSATVYASSDDGRLRASAITQNGAPVVLQVAPRPTVILVQPPLARRDAVER